MSARALEGERSGRDVKVGIVASRFNNEVVEGLLRGALEVLEEAGVLESDVIISWVPGALELPLAAGKLIDSEGVDGVIALGCVIRGETAHFEHVSREAVSGLNRVSLELGRPVTTGILTVENLEQARIRSGLDPDPSGGKEGRSKHRGREAAGACLEMVDLLRRIGDG
jgi:6,7-dimethyl-8-ribityllumazine synthase